MTNLTLFARADICSQFMQKVCHYIYRLKTIWYRHLHPWLAVAKKRDFFVLLFEAGKIKLFVSCHGKLFCTWMGENMVKWPLRLCNHPTVPPPLASFFAYYRQEPLQQSNLWHMSQVVNLNAYTYYLFPTRLICVVCILLQYQARLFFLDQFSWTMTSFGTF